LNADNWVNQIQSHLMKATLFLFALFAAFGAIAHPGGLDANGGHTDRKTGVYHYHRGTNAPSGNARNASPVDVETNRIEMESATTELQTMPAEDGSAPALFKLPRWVYLVGLGGGCLLWVIASHLYQKRKGNR
jgi:hypothetical protein